MAFNPLKNRTQINTQSSAERFRSMLKTPDKIGEKEDKEETNHKSNLYKILKAKTNLEQSELIDLTNMIDDYYTKRV